MKVSTDHSYQTPTPGTEKDCIYRNITETHSYTLYSIFLRKNNILVKEAISSSGLDIGLRYKQGKPLHSRLAFQQLSPDETYTKRKCPINDQSICCVTGCVYMITLLFCK